MILTKVYEEFLKNTNLLDATYKTVFVRVNDVFSFLNQIKFKKFKYTLETDSIVFDFDNLDSNSIPSYVIDTIKNLFDRFFDFPRNSEILLELEFNNKSYQVKHTKGITEIPSQIDFLEKYKLFPFFIANYSNLDSSETFDYLFRFLSIKDSQKSVFSPLRNLFERVDAIETVDKNEVTEKSAASYSLVIEDLQDNKEKLVKQLDEIKTKREEAKKAKEDLLQYSNFREKYEIEYNSLVDEHKYLREQKNSYLSKYQELLQLLKEIDRTLSDLNAAEKKDESELKYYLDHKRYLQEKGTILTNTVKELSGLQDATKFRIEELEGIFEKYSKFKLEDLEKISKDLEKLEKKEEKLYATLLDIDGNIKHARESQNKEERIIEKSNYSDHVIQTSLSQAIPEFLSKSDLPQSVTIVKNYLKQYFMYNCEKIQKQLHEKELAADVIFSVLFDNFGLNPLMLFSTSELSNYKNIILIEN